MGVLIGALVDARLDDGAIAEGVLLTSREILLSSGSGEWNFSERVEEGGGGFLALALAGTTTSTVDIGGALACALSSISSSSSSELTDSAAVYVVWSSGGSAAFSGEWPRAVVKAEVPEIFTGEGTLALP